MSAMQAKKTRSDNTKIRLPKSYQSGPPKSDIHRSLYGVLRKKNHIKMCLTTVMPFNSSQRYNLTKRDLSPGFIYYLGADTGKLQSQWISE